MSGNPRRPWLALAVLCLGTFAVLMDTTIVNVALPSLITSLHAPLAQAIWVVNAYLLVFAALLILAGRLGDILGPRRMFVAGLALFALASAACGAAQSPAELIAARAVQGVGAAALTPQALVLIQAIFPRERMGTAMGVSFSMIGLAAVSGPTLGGLLTTYLSWRWVFYVNLPIAAAGIILAFAVVPEVRTSRRQRLDVTGVVAASAGLAALSYGLIEGQSYSWGTVAGFVTIPEIIAAGVIALAVFAVWEGRQREPLMPLRLFRSGTFAIMVVLSTAVQFALQSMLLVNSVNLQSVLGFTAIRAGLTGLPLTIVMTALAPFAGRLTDRVGGKYVLMAGLITYAAGIAGVAAVSSARATSLTFAPALVVAGLGMGAIFAPIATMAMRAAPPALAGAASGVLNTGRQLGATLGGAITGAVLSAQLTARLHTPAAGLQVGRGEAGAGRDVFARAFIAAIHPALGIPAAVLLAAAAACVLLRRHPAAAPPTAAVTASAPAGTAQPSRSQDPPALVTTRSCRS